MNTSWARWTSTDERAWLRQLDYYAYLHEELDQNLGDLLSTLDELGIYDDTVIATPLITVTPAAATACAPSCRVSTRRSWACPSSSRFPVLPSRQQRPTHWRLMSTSPPRCALSAESTSTETFVVGCRLDPGARRSGCPSA